MPDAASNGTIGGSDKQPDRVTQPATDRSGDCDGKKLRLGKSTHVVLLAQIACDFGQGDGSDGIVTAARNIANMTKGNTARNSERFDGSVMHAFVAQMPACRKLSLTIAIKPCQRL